MKITVLFEDQDLLVIDKPALVVVNNAQTVRGETIQSWFEKRNHRALKQADWRQLVPDNFNDQFGSPEEIFALRQGLVHRLDKDTQGVLVLAKNPGALVNLLAQFKQRRVKKTYLALVHGKLEPREGELNFPIGRSKQRLKMAVVSTGRTATTQYRVKKYHLLHDSWFEQLQNKTSINVQVMQKMKNLYSQGMSEVICFPKTGRMHQIRVHLQHIGHPVVGDKLYAGRKKSKFDRLWVPHHQLIAQEIVLFHPRTNATLKIETHFELADLC